MNKTDALVNIKEVWEDSSLSLGDKILQISSNYYDAGLDLDVTARFLKTTEAELGALLDFSEFNDEIIDRLSKINPPRTTWTVLSSASDEEIVYALKTLESMQDNPKSLSDMADEYVYQVMIEVSGLTIEQKVSNLSGDILKHALKKGQDFGALSEYDSKFMKSIASQKKRGKVLSEKQIAYLIKVINKLIDKGAITHGSIDGDQEICEEILKAVER